MLAGQSFERTLARNESLFKVEFKDYHADLQQYACSI